MEQRVKNVVFICVICIIFGFLLYRIYKKYYEKKINKVLLGEKVKAVTPGAIMKVYFVLSLVLMIIVAVTTPTYKMNQDECHLIDYVTLSMIRQEEKDAMFKDIQPEKKGDQYSLQIKKIDDDLTVYYAANAQKFGYILEYKLNRKMGDDEIFHLAINGASSNISAQDLEDDKITLFIKGNLMKGCDSIEQTIEIYNFCKGENKHPVHIKKKIIVGSGGIKI